MVGIFNLDHGPVPGSVEHLQPDLRCLTASNASPMTFTGTRTYLVGEGEVALVDPGPDDPAHLAAILAALAPGEQITHILLTHSHVDHSAGVRALQVATGAPVYAFGRSTAGRSPRMEALAAQGLGGGEGIDHAFGPDRMLVDGARLQGPGWTFEALHTPGHISNHLCFHWLEGQAIFSGDHVMGWATTLVSPPDGDLGAFMGSLAYLRTKAKGCVLYPGHGAPVSEPVALIDHITAHRRMREDQILQALQSGDMTVAELTQLIYRETPPALHAAAERNVFAHLVDLSERGLVRFDGVLTPSATFKLAR